jgi:non-specific serine/threonine protein kinase
MIGTVVSAALAVVAWRQRDLAVSARLLADAGFRFIAEDVLASADPASSAADETVIDAIRRAGRSIDQRFADSPSVAARLHLAVARAFHGRGEFDLARDEYARADAWFARAGESEEEDAVLGRLGRIHLDATSGQPGRIEEAGRLLAAERRRLGSRADAGRIGFALSQAEGAYGYMADIQLAERAFRRAAAIAAADPASVSDSQRLKVESSLALTLMRLGRPGEAEPIARSVVAASSRTRGRDHPDTLVARQHWVTALSMLGRHEEALGLSAPLLGAMQKRFGPDHRFTLALHSTRFESLAALGRYGEASQEADRVWRGASSQTGPLSHQALVGQIDYASALCRTSDRGRALGIARDALSKAEEAFGQQYPLTHVIRLYVAECLIAERRLPEAGDLLAGVDRAKVADLTGQPAIGGLVDLGLAEVALARGDRAMAVPLVAAAGERLGDPQDPVVRARLSNARRQVALRD